MISFVNKNCLNAVVILDAIPDGELNTAKRLKEDLEDLANFIVNGLRVRYARVETLDSLEAFLSDVLCEIHETNLLPLLHLEGHGLTNEDDFVLLDGKHCTWSELKELITPLNIATGLNLILVMATCYGGSFAKAILTIDRAPVWGLIGPKHSISAGQIQCDFGAFYRIFFETSSGSKAIDVLTANASRGLYYMTSAEWFFYDVWKGYKKNLCSKKMIRKRAQDMYKKSKAMNLPKTPSIGQLKRMITKDEKSFFEKYRDKYFMYDLYSHNRSRFHVTYEEAEHYVIT